MTRRGFLGRLLAGGVGLAVGAELDLERLLWVPKPMVTVPDLVGVDFGYRQSFTVTAVVDGNRFVTPDWMARELLKQMRRDVHFAAEVLRVHEAHDFKVGDVITFQSQYQRNPPESLVKLAKGNR